MAGSTRSQPPANGWSEAFPSASTSHVRRRRSMPPTRDSARCRVSKPPPIEVMSWSHPSRVDGRRGMLDTDAVHRLARRQLGDYRRHKPGTLFDDGLELGIEDAYAVQLEVAALRLRDGERVAGFKVGCTGATVRAQFGMDGPVSGMVCQSEIHPSGSTV